MSVVTKANEYLTARALYEVAHQVSASRHAAMKSAEYELIDSMLDECVPSIGLDTDDDGNKDVTISLRNQATCSVTKDNEHSIRQWLIEFNGSDEDFIEERVNKAALMEWIKSQLSAPNDFDESVMPTELKFSSRPGLQVRGLNSKEKK